MADKAVLTAFRVFSIERSPMGAFAGIESITNYDRGEVAVLESSTSLG